MPKKKEEQLLSQLSRQNDLTSGVDIEKLLSDFDAHQIELELQNIELKRTHQALRSSYENFARTYNLSPVGYITLDEQGVIKKANAPAVQLLNTPKERLFNIKLSDFIDTIDRDNYNVFIHELVLNKKNRWLNVKLDVKKNTLLKAECPGMDVHGCSKLLCNHNKPFIYVELRGCVNKSNAENYKIYLTIQDVTEYK